MAGELAFKYEAAAEYDRAFAHVTAHLCLSCCGPPMSHRVCTSLILRRARAFRPRRRSPPSAPAAIHRR